MRKINYPILALIVSNIIWGAASPIFKFAFQNIPPLSLAFLRFLIAACILYPLVHKNIDLKDLKNKWLWLFSISGVSLNIIFFFIGLTTTNSINTPIIASSGPLFILIFSAMYLHERVNQKEIIGTVLGFFGVLIIIFEPLLAAGVDGSIVGNLLLFLSMLGATGGVIFGRKFLTEKNVFGATFWSFLIGTLTFLPFMLLEYGHNPGWMANLDYRGWTGILFGGFLSSALAYSIYDWSIAKLPANRVSVFTYIDPVVAILIAVPLLGEKLTLPFIVGSVLVFIGILIAEGRLNWHPLDKLVIKH